MFGMYSLTRTPIKHNDLRLYIRVSNVQPNVQ